MWLQRSWLNQQCSDANNGKVKQIAPSVLFESRNVTTRVDRLDNHVQQYARYERWLAMYHRPTVTWDIYLEAESTCVIMAKAAAMPTCPVTYDRDLGAWVMCIFSDLRQQRTSKSFRRHDARLNTWIQITKNSVTLLSSLTVPTTSPLCIQWIGNSEHYGTLMCSS